MESKDLIFNLIESLLFPVLVFEKDAADTWKSVYLNKSMQELLYSNKPETNVSDKSAQDHQPDPYAPLLNEYKKSSNQELCSLYDIELFKGLYNVHFHKQEEKLFAFFVEVPLDSIFENFPFHDFNGVSNAVVVVLDTQGELVDANECFCTLVGEKKPSLLGKKFFESFIPGNLDKLQEYLRGIYEKEDFHQHFITSLKGVKNINYRINWQVSKIRWHDQSYIVAIGSDISQLMEENTELKKQLTSIQVGFDYFPFAIAYMNAKGDFTKFNSRFVKMFSVKEDTSPIHFDKVALFKEHIGFAKMSEYIKLVKEMSYTINHTRNDKAVKLKIDIRLLSGKKASSKFYIIVVQQLK